MYPAGPLPSAGAAGPGHQSLMTARWAGSCALRLREAVAGAERAGTVDELAGIDGALDPGGRAMCARSCIVSPWVFQHVTGPVAVST